MASVSLSIASAEYVTHRRTHRSPKTVLADERVLRALRTSLGDILVSSITTQHVDRHLSRRQTGGLAAASLNLEISILRGFFMWCAEMRYSRSALPVRTGQRTKEDPRDWNYVRIEQFPELLDAAANPRDRMIIALGLYLFLRGSEITTIKLSDIHMEEGTILIHVWKTRKIDVAPIPDELKEELGRYLSWYGSNVDLSAEGSDDYYLVPRFSPPVCRYRHSLGRLAPVEAAQLLPSARLGKVTVFVKSALAKIGLDAVHEGGHTLRRSGARALYAHLMQDGKYDDVLRILQAMLHHDSVMTTERYLRLDLDRARRDRMVRSGPMFGAAIVGAPVRKLRVV